jgi:hypothetical protein
LDEVCDYFCDFCCSKRVVVRGPQIYVGYLLVVCAFDTADQLAEFLDGDCFLFGGVLRKVAALLATYLVVWVTHFYLINYKFLP